MTPPKKFWMFSILEKYPKDAALHARIGKQLYKGGVHLDAFQACVDNETETIL
jgi:hypothetical protein